MKALFLMSSPRSHIIPVEPLIKELLNKKCIVYCMSTKNNQEMIERFGGTFLEYPDFIEPASCNNLDLNNVMEKTNEFWKSGDIEGGYDYIIEKDIESVFDITSEQIEYLCQIVKKLKIDVLFRDAVDKLGRFVKERMGICCIGYMTHNMYSKKYFEKNADELYTVFMNAKWRTKHLPEGYFCNLRKRAEDYYEEFGADNFPIYTYHQLDPMSDFTIIFSSEELQPKESFYNYREYLIVKPLKSRYSIEDKIDDNLQIFINKYQYKIYISSGSFVTQSYSYYKNLIDVLKVYNIGIIVSAGKFNEPLQKHLDEEGIDNVYISHFIPQKYVLSNTDIFITSGGQNSILESIYYQTPLLVTPMTSEQRINGLLVKKLGIGETTYSLNDNSSISSLLNKLLNREIDEEHLQKMSNQLKCAKNDFANMWKYIHRSASI